MSRLLVVSNRLPVTVEWNGDEPQVRPSSGGLVSALNAVFEHCSGAWIGWPGTSSSDDRLAHRFPSTPNLEMIPVFLTEQERQDFYCGFSNEIIWPLFHDLQSRCIVGCRNWVWVGCNVVNSWCCVRVVSRLMSCWLMFLFLFVVMVF